MYIIYNIKFYIFAIEKKLPGNGTTSGRAQLQAGPTSSDWNKMEISETFGNYVIQKRLTRLTHRCPLDGIPKERSDFCICLSHLESISVRFGALNLHQLHNLLTAERDKSFHFTDPVDFTHLQV